MRVVCYRLALLSPLSLFASSASRPARDPLVLVGRKSQSSFPRGSAAADTTSPILAVTILHSRRFSAASRESRAILFPWVLPRGRQNSEAKRWSLLPTLLGFSSIFDNCDPSCNYSPTKKTAIRARVRAGSEDNRWIVFSFFFDTRAIRSLLPALLLSAFFYARLTDALDDAQRGVRKNPIKYSRRAWSEVRRYAKGGGRRLRSRDEEAPSSHTLLYYGAVSAGRSC